MDPMLLEVQNSGYGDEVSFDLTKTNLKSLVSGLETTTMDDKLFEAVTSRNPVLMESLLRGNRRNFEQVTAMKDTAIHIAAKLGHLETVRSFHNQCPNLFTQVNLMGDTPLHTATRSGHFNIVSFLIRCAKKSLDTSSAIDVEIGRTEVINIMRKGNRENDTVMHEAVRSGRLEMVKLFIHEDPELLCIVNHAGESPLHIAVQKQNLDIVEQILESNRYSCKGPNGRTALHASVIHQSPDITKLLLDKTPELIREADDNKRTPLHFAAALWNTKTVKMLLECDTSTTCFLDKSGYAPIHISAHFGRLGILQEFIRVQPQLAELLDGNWQNVIHIAVKRHQVGIIKYALKKKVFQGMFNGKDRDGNTPLHHAAISGNPYIVNILVVNKNIDVMALNRKRLTALEIARSLRDESKTQEKDQDLVIAALLFVPDAPWSNHGKPWYRRSTVMREIIGHGSFKTGDSIDLYRNQANTLLVVATLVSTVTFAAGFTLPGGYHTEGPLQGKAILQNIQSFDVFVLLDAIGMLLSILSVVALIWIQFARQLYTVRIILLTAQLLTTLSITFMTMAFVVGLSFTVSESEWLPTTISYLGYISFSIPLVSLIMKLLQHLFWGMLLSKKWVFLLSFIYDIFKERENDVSLLLRYD